MHRWSWSALSLLVVACARPAPSPSPVQPSIDIPAHTQAMIDAYREQMALLQGAAPVQAPRCPSDDSAVVLRERYLRAIDGCVEESDGMNPELTVGARAQWPALYAALDARKGEVDRCIREAFTWFDLSGALVTRLEVAADGAIRGVRTMRDDAAEPALSCCVRRALRQAHVPAPGRAIALEYDSSFDGATLNERYSGTLDPEALKRVIGERGSELRSCYENAVEQGLHREGRVTVRFVIAPSGEVPRATVIDDGIGSPTAACCFVEKLRGWKFPPPAKGGPVHVTYPLDVRLGDSARDQ